MATASRSDLKVELLQELERQNIKILQKRKTQANEKLIKQINVIKNRLEKNHLQPGYFFGDDRLIQEIKSRSDSPYGILSVDFPVTVSKLDSKCNQSKGCGCKCNPNSPP